MKEIMTLDPTIIGYIAGTLTTICFIPQVLKVVRDRQTQGVSLLTFVVYFIGVAGWLLYGILLESQPIIIFNTLSLILVIPIIVMKIRLG